MSQEFDLFSCPLEGVTLVEAGAGTGKTYNIASIYIRLLIEKQLPVSDILVLTYTEAATAELKARLRKRLKESIEALEEGLTDHKDPFLSSVATRYGASVIPHLYDTLYRFDEAPIATIHGFCQRLLKEHPLGFGVSPDFEILPDQTEVLQEVVDAFWRDQFQDSGDPFDVALQWFLTEHFGDPDSLLITLMPLIAKPYAKKVPDAPDLQYFRSKYDQLRQHTRILYRQLKEDEQEVLDLLRSGKLNGNTYRADAPEHFRGFIDTVAVDKPDLTAHHKAANFGSVLYTKIKKTYQEENIRLRITDQVDRYLELIDEFKLLGAAFTTYALDTVSNTFREYKNRRNLLGYDDLLQNVQRGLTDELILTLRESYPVALLDEFQDTDPVQYDIFRKIYVQARDSKTALFMIGDPKQAIYKFRGADIHTYLKAGDDARQTYTLTHNYRSTPDMIRAVNTVFGHTEDPFVLEGLHFEPARYPDDKPVNGQLFASGLKEPPLQFLEVDVDSTKVGPARQQIAEHVADHIVRLLNREFTLDSDPVREQDIAVLVRKNRQAMMVQQALRDRGVTSVLRGNESVYQTHECNELTIILNAVASRGNEDRIRAALSTDMLGFNASKIRQLHKDQHEWTMVAESFNELKDVWSSWGIRALREKLIELFKVEEQLTNYPDAERRITNLNHLFELLAELERETQATPAVLNRLLKVKRNHERKATEEEVVRLESDDKLVQIVTLHSSKGLQYPVVYIPYLWDGPSNQRKPYEWHEDGDTCIDIGSVDPELSQHKSMNEWEDIAEGVRLAYVGLTRSESACFVHFCDQNAASYSTLTLLAEGQRSLLERKSGSSKKGEFDLRAPLQRLCEKDDSLVMRKALAVKDNGVSGREEDQKETLKVAVQKGAIPTPEVISSYSSLTRDAHRSGTSKEDDAYDYDQLHEERPAVSESASSYRLPAGAATGTMLHKIFEQIRFDDPDDLDEVVEKEIRSAGMDDRWRPVVQAMILNTLQHELSEGIRLQDLSKDHYVAEIEFYLPQHRVSFGEILRIIRGSGTSSLNSSEHDLNGYLKGFIDLTFRIGDTYYLADYKSNYLGDQPADYSDQQLNRAMLDSFYDVQYHLYTLALHRHLKNTINGYNYDDHVGGAYYLFMRGIQSGLPGSGVFMHKPSRDVIEQLDDHFSGGRS